MLRLTSLSAFVGLWAIFYFAYFAASAQAANYTWDTSAASGITAGSGTWGTDSYWTTDGSTLVAWPGAANGAVFTGADGSYAISLNGSISANSITFTNAGYTLGTGNLTINGGGLVVNANATINSTINFGATQNWTVAGGKTLSIGSTLTGGKAIVNFVPGTGTISLAPSNTNTNGILGGWAIVNGSDFATVSSGTIAALSSYTALPVSGGDGATNYNLIANTTLTASQTINALKLNPATSTTLTMTGYTLKLNSGGLLINSASAQTITGGTLTAASGTPLYISNAGADLTLTSTLAGNGGVVLRSAQKVTMTTTNTFSGGMYYDGLGGSTGYVVVNADANFGATGNNWTVNNGFIKSAGSFTIAASRTITMGPSGGGFSAGSSSNLTIASLLTGSGPAMFGYDGNGLYIVQNTANNYAGDTRIGVSTISAGYNATFRVGGNGVIPYGTGKGNVVLAYNAPNAGKYAMLDLYGNSININGLVCSNTFGQVDNTSGSGTYTLTLGNADATATYAGFIKSTSGSLAIAKTGTGVQTLSGSNSYKGGTTINAGAMQFSKTVSMPATGTVAVQTGGGLYVNVGGTSEWTTGTSGTGTIGGLLAGVGGQGNTVNYTGNVTLGLDTTNASTTQTYAGNIADVGTMLGITKLGAGTLILTGSNSYTGGTTISAGALQFGKTLSMPATGTVAVATGGSLNVNVGGTGEWTTGTSGGGTIGGLLAGIGGQGNSVTYAGAVTLGIDTTNGGTQTYSGAIGNPAGSTSLALNKLGTGTLTLDQANTYTGGTTISSGTVRVMNSDSALGTGTVTFTGGNLQAGDDGRNLANAISLGSNTGTIDTQANNLTLSGSITGGATGTLAKGGAGTLFLTGGATLKALTLNAGTIDLSKDMILSNAGSVSLSGSGGTINSSGGKIVLASGAAGNYMDWSSTGTITINAPITESTAGLAIDFYNAGTIVLTNTTSNYSGVLDLVGTTLSTPNIGMSGATSPLGKSGTFNLGMTTGAGKIVYTGTGETTDKVVNLYGTTGGGTIDQSGSGLLKFTSNLTASGSGAKTLTLQGSTAGTGEIAGAIVNGAAATSVTKAGTGTWTLSGANTYTGVTTLTGGTLAVTGTSVTSGYIISGGTGTTLLITNPAASGTGNFTMNTGTTTPVVQLHIDGGDNGVIALPNALGGNSGITTTFDVNNFSGSGSGNQIQLNGAMASSAIGTVTYNIQGGNGYGLYIANLRCTAGGAGNVTFNPTTAVVTLGNLTGGSNATTWVLDGTNSGNAVTGVIANGSAASAVTKSNVSTWTLSGANTYTGATTVSGGTLNIQNRTAAAGTITVAGAGATLNLGTGNNFSMGSNQIAVGSSSDGTVTQSSGTVSFTGGNALLVGNGAATGGSTTTYNLTGGALSSYASTTRGVMLGVNAGTAGNIVNAVFNLSGSGVLSLAISELAIGRNDSAQGYTNTAYNQTGGTATVGYLALGNASVTNAVSSMTITGGTFQANSIQAVASNTNSIYLGGSAQVTLGAFPTPRAGATSTMTLDFTGGGFLAPYAASTTYLNGFTNVYLTSNGANFNVDSGKDITIAQVLEDASGQNGTLTKQGAGTLTLTGNNTFTGSTTISGGSLVIGGAGLLGGGAYAGNIINNGSLAFNSSANQTVSGSISGSGSVTTNGTGVLTLTGTNNYAGVTNITSGALMAASPAALSNYATSGQVVFNGGTIGVLVGGAGWSSGDIQTLLDNAVKTSGALGLDTSNVDIATSSLTFTGLGSLGLAKLGSGTMTADSVATYTGPTFVYGGTMALSVANALNQNTVTVAGGNLTQNITDALGGTAGLTVSGGNALLTHANNFTGAVTLTGGNLQLADVNAIASASGLALNGGTLQLRSDTNNTLFNTPTPSIGGNTTIDVNNLSGGGSPAGNTLSLSTVYTTVGSATNTINVTGGNGYGLYIRSVTIQNNNATGQAALAFNPTTANVNLGNVYGVSAGGGKDVRIILDGTSTGNVVSGNIFAASGGGYTYLNKQGSGTWTLSGSNSYQGGTTITGGTLKLGNAYALAPGASNAYPLSVTGGTLDLNGFNATVAGLAAGNAAGTITDNTVGSGTSTLTLTYPGGVNVATKIADGANGQKIAVVVQNNGNGTGGLANTANTFSGGFYLSPTGGVNIRLSAIGSYYGTGPIVMGQAPGDHVQFYGTGTLSNNLIINSAGGTDRSGDFRIDSGQTLNLTGSINANLASLTFGNNSAGGVANVSGPVYGNAGITLTPYSTNGMTVVLSNTGATPNSYAGTTSIGSYCTLKLGANDQIPNGAGTGNVAVAGTLNLNGFSDTINGLSGAGVVDNAGSGSSTLAVGDYNLSTTFTGTIKNTSGTLGITKIGAGGLTLTGTNTFAGGLNVNAGAVVFTNDVQLGVAGGAITLNGGTMKGGAAATLPLSASRTITLGSGTGYFSAGSSSTIQIDSKLTGSGAVGFNYDGAGSYVLTNAANDYTGDTLIGTKGPFYWASGSAVAKIKMGAVNALPYGAGKGNVVVGYVANDVATSVSTLDLNGNNTNINGLTTNNAAYAVVDNSSYSGVTLTLGNGDASAAYGGVIQNSGAPMALVKTGTGAQALSGANSYTGGTTVNAGQLYAAHANALGLGAVTVNAGGSLGLQAGGSYLSLPLTLSGDGGGLGALQNIQGANAWTGSVTLAGGATIASSGYTGNSLEIQGTIDLNNTGIGTQSLTVAPNNSTADGVITISGQIMNSNGTGTLTLNGGANARLILTNNGNSYSGETAITGGSLILRDSAAINSSSSITINGANARLVQNSAVQVTATVNLLQGALDGTGSVATVNVAAGTGTVVTAGNGTASGTLTIDTLNFAGAGTIAAIGNGASSGSTLQIGTINTASAPIAVNASNAGGWTEGTTYVLANYGTLTGSGTFTKGLINDLIGRQSANVLDTGGQIQLSVFGDSPVWTGGVSGLWTTGTISGGFNWQLIKSGDQTQFIPNDVVLFNDIVGSGATTISIADAGVSPFSTTFDNSTHDYTLTGPYGILAGSLSKNGTGKLTISTSNSYSGATTLNGGTIVIDNVNALGNTSVLTVNSGGLLDVNGNSIVLNSIAGSGTIDNVIAGGAPTLTVGSGTYDGVLQNTTGALALTKTGAGTLALTSGGSTYTGGTDIQAGTLNFANGSLGAGNIALGTATLQWASGNTQDISGRLILVGGMTATLDTNGNDVTFAGTFGGGTASSLIKTGAGTLNITGNGTYTGATTVNGGTLQYSGAGGYSGGGALVMAAGGSGILNVATSGTVSVGSVTWSGSNAGTVQLTSGTLLAGGSISTSIQVGNALVFAGGTLKSGAPISISGSLPILIAAGGGTIDTSGGNISCSPGIGYTGSSGNDTFTITGGHTLTGQFTVGSPWTGMVALTGAGTKWTQTTADSLGGALSVDSGATFEMNGYAATFGGLAGSGTILNSSGTGSYTLTVNTAGNSSFAGTIRNTSGTLALTKTGDGTQTLSGVNSYSGATTVAAGTLAITGGGTIGGGALAVSNGTLDLGSTSQTVGAVTLTGTGSILNGSLTGSSIVVSNTSGTATINASLQGAATALTKSGSGTLSLGGVSSYGGNTTLSGGTLRTTVSGALSSASSLVLGSANVTLDIGSTTQTVSSMAFQDQVAVTGTVTGAGGALVVNGASNFQMGPTTASSAVSQTVSIAGLSNFAFVNTAGGSYFRVGYGNGGTGTNTLTLAGSNSITAGNLHVANSGGANGGGTGILHLGAANVINTNNINVGFSNRSNATLDFSGTGSTATFRNTDGTSPISTWYIGSANSYSTTTWTSAVNFTNGTIDALVNTMDIGFADIGTGTGRAGVTNASFTLGAGTMAVTNLNIGQISNSTTGSVAASNTLAGNGTFTMNNAAGTLTGGTITLANNAITDTTGTRRVSGIFNLTNGTLKAGTIQRGSQDGTATATVAFNWTNGTIQNPDGADALITSVPLTLAAGAHTFNATGSNSITVDANSPIGGASGITKEGSGTLILAANNTYTGVTSINGGAIKIGSVNALATSSTVNIGSAAALNLNGSNATIKDLTGNGIVDNTSGTGAYVLTTSGAGNSTFGGTIQNTSGTVALNKTGAGTLTLTGANTYSGGTNILNGFVSIGSTAALPGWDTAGRYTVANGAGIAVVNSFDNAAVATMLASNNFAAGAFLGFDTTSGDRTVTTVLGDSANGALGLVKMGANTLVLGVHPTYTGGTTILGGTLDLHGNLNTFSSLSGSGGVLTDLSATGTTLLTVNQNVNTTYNGSINNGAGVIALHKSGTGVLTLGGSNNFTGGVTIGNSTLAANITTTLNPLGTNAVNVGAGSTMLLNNTATAGTVTITNSFTGSGLLKLNFAAGTTGRNTYMTGNLNGYAGTLELSNGGTNGDKLNLQYGINAPGMFVQVDNASQLFVNTTASTFAGVSIVGTGNSENRGAIRLTNTLNAPVTLAGNATIGSEGGTINGNVSAAGAYTLTMGTANSAGTATLNGVLSDGSGTLAVTNAYGTTTLAGANTYSGTTTITGGVILAVDNVGLSPNSNLNISGGAFGVINSTTFSRSLGTGAGQVQINSGGLGAYGAPGYVALNGGATLTWGLAGFNPTVLSLNASTANNALHWLNSIDLNNTGTILSRTFATSGNVGYIDGVLTTSNGSANVAFSGGTSVLRAANTYSGDTTVLNGYLTLANPAGRALYSGLATHGKIYISNSATLTNTPYLQFGAANQLGSDINVVFASNTGGYAQMSTLGYNQTIGSIELPYNSARAVIQNMQGETINTNAVLTINQNADLTYNGYIRDKATGTGTGTLGITKSGTSVLTLTGANITYTGPTRIEQGKVVLNGATAFASTVFFDTGDTGVLELAGTAARVGGLSSNGAVGTVRPTAGSFVTLTINQSGTSTYGGVITDTYNTDYNSQLALTKVGVGTQGLSGDNTFTGALTITGGFIQVAADGTGTPGAILTSPLSTGTVTLAGGGLTADGTARTVLNSVNLSGLGLLGAAGSDPLTLAGGLTLYQTGTLSVGSDVTAAGGIFGGYALTKSGTGTLHLNNTAFNQWSGGMIITQGMVLLDNPDASGQHGAPNIEIKNAALGLNFTGVQSFLASAVNSAGCVNPTIAMASNSATESIDFAAAGLPTGFLGATGSVNYTGVHTPGTAGVYRLGGGGGDLYFQQILSGTDSVIMGNYLGGTVHLNTANTYSGGTTINGVTFVINADSIVNSGTIVSGPLGTGTVNLNGATLLSDGPHTLANTVTMSGLLTLGNGTYTDSLDLAGAASLAGSTTIVANSNLNAGGITASSAGYSLTKSGSATMTLGPSTYQGATAVTGGTLQLTAADAIASSGSVAVTGGTLDVNGLNQTLHNLSGGGTIDNLSAGGSVVLTVNNASDTTFGGNILNTTGTLSLVKTGTNTLRLSGNNGYAGTTAVTGGTLLAATPGSLPNYGLAGNVSVVGGATLVLQTGDGTAGFSAGQIDGLLGAVSFADNTAALGLDTTNGDFTYGSAITANIALTKLGANALVLAGNSTYGGSTTLAAGMLVVGADSVGSVGAITSSPIGTGGLTFTNGTLASDADRTLYNAINMGGAFSLGNATYAGTLNLEAPVSLTANAVITVNNTTNFAGGITSAGNYTLTKNGLGSMVVGNSTFTGDVTVSAGTYAINGTSPAKTYNVSFGATLDVRHDTTVNTIGGTGTVTNAGGSSPVTLTVGANDTTATIYNTLTDGGTGKALTLAKTGTGTITLNTAATYTGATIVSAGTLKLAGIPSNPVTTNLSYQLDAMNLATLFQDAARTTTVTANGQAVQGWSDASGNGVNFSKVGVTYAPIYNATGFNGLPTLSWTGSTAQDARLAAATAATAATVFIVCAPGTLAGNSGLWGQYNADYGIRGNSTYWYNGTGGNNNDFTNGTGNYMIVHTSTGDITGTGNLSWGSTPNQIVEAYRSTPYNNTQAIGAYWNYANRYYTGNISEILVFSTSLSANDKASVENYLYSKWFLGATGAGTNILPVTTALQIADGATLDLNGDSQQVGSLADSGIVTGTGMIALGAGTLTVGDASNTLYSGVISGTGNLVKTGAGTLTLAGSLTYVGTTLVNQGTLQLNNTGPADNIAIGSAGTLAGNFTADTTYAGTVIGSGTFAKIGAGTMQMTGDNTGFAGTAVVSNGGLKINGAGLGATSSILVNNGGVLSGTGSVGHVVVNSGGVLAVGNSVGTQHEASLTLNAGSILETEFNATPANDQIIVDNIGGLTINGGTFRLYEEGTTNTFNATNGSYQLIQYNGAIDGTGVSALAVDPSTKVATKAYRFTADGTWVSMDVADKTTSVLQLTDGTHHNMLGGGTIDLTAVVTNNSGWTGDEMTYTVTGDITGTGIVAADKKAFVTAAYTQATYGSYSFSATATGSNVNLGGDATNSPQSFGMTVVVGKATAGNGVFVVDNALYSKVASGTDYSTLLLSSSVVTVGALDSLAVITGGTASADRLVSMNWRTRTTDESDMNKTIHHVGMPADAYNLLSDVVSLTGTGGDSLTVVVTYDPTKLTAGYSETYLAGANKYGVSWIYLAELVGGTWTKVTGSQTLDTTNHWVLATVTHDGVYAVVPEPGTMALLLVGGVGVVLRRRRK